MKNKEKESEAFLKSIRGVKPINKKNTIKKEVPTVKNIKNTALGKTVKDENFEQKQTIQTKEIKDITKDGVLYTSEKNKINRRLKRGKVSIDKKIDFHGCSLAEAEEIFLNTIKNCYLKNLRCILFITGKGIYKKKLNNEEKTKLYYGKIRNSFIEWTKKRVIQSYILSVEQANLEYGADGAFFVYLRKNKN